VKLVGVRLEHLQLSQELRGGLVLQPADPLRLPGLGTALPNPSEGIWEMELLFW